MTICEFCHVYSSTSYFIIICIVTQTAFVSWLAALLDFDTFAEQHTLCVPLKNIHLKINIVKFWYIEDG